MCRILSWLAGATHTRDVGGQDSCKNYSSQVHLQALVTGAVENRGAVAFRNAVSILRADAPPPMLTTKARKAALNSPEYVAAVARFDQVSRVFQRSGTCDRAC